MRVKRIRSYVKFWLYDMLGWRFLSQVVGGGLLFYEGVGMAHPFKPFSQCMVNRGVVVVVVVVARFVFKPCCVLFCPVWPFWCCTVSFVVWVRGCGVWVWLSPSARAGLPPLIF